MFLLTLADLRSSTKSDVAVADQKLKLTARQTATVPARSSDGTRRAETSGIGYPRRRRPSSGCRWVSTPESVGIQLRHASPCSVHDPEQAIEYAKKLHTYAEESKDDLLIVMRVYFEK